MGLKVERWWQIAWIIVSLFMSSLVEASDTYDQDSLDTFLCKQANKVIEKPRTGVFYNISLPGNFTGIEISVVRFRTVSFWLRGVNYSFFNIPKRVVPQPNRKRMAILYENLGNWSSYYYNVPNHTMLAPVFGVIPYTSSETTLIDCDEKMNLIIQGKPIRIKFPHIMPYAKNVTPICVNFGAGGTVKFRKMIKPHVCEVKSEGHYTIVVPSTKSETQKNMNKGFNIWWVLGFVTCFVGLVVLVLVLIIIVKVVKRRKIRKMEKFSEKGEAFDTFWIGESKVPFALMMRTQPVLENEDVPH